MATKVQRKHSFWQTMMEEYLHRLLWEWMAKCQDLLRAAEDLLPVQATHDKSRLLPTPMEGRKFARRKRPTVLSINRHN